MEDFLLHKNFAGLVLPHSTFIRFITLFLTFYSIFVMITFESFQMPIAIVDKTWKKLHDLVMNFRKILILILNQFIIHIKLKSTTQFPTKLESYGWVELNHCELATPLKGLFDSSSQFGILQDKIHPAPQFLSCENSLINLLKSIFTKNRM